MDDNGHGSHCAGIIGALGDNGKGVVGVNWDIQLMPLKFLNAGGSGTTDNAIDAVLYAADKNVRITSNSWGGGRKSKALENAIKDSGALFIASAGNSGNDRKLYPAGHALDNIISVAATRNDDTLWPSSSFGADWVDLGAPGHKILSCIRDNGYGLKTGTSMAAPHVAGAAALLMAKDGSLTNAQIKSTILDNVDPLTSLSGKTVTGGRLNIRAVVGASELPADSTAPSSTTDLAVDPTVTQTSLTLRWTAPGDDGTVGTAYLYDLRYSESTITEANWDSATAATGEPVPQSYLSSETFTITALASGTTFYFALKTADEVGNYGGLSNVASGTTEASPWSVEVIESGVGLYNSLAYDSSGNPAVAYGAGETIKLARWNGASWDIETVFTETDIAGIDLAFDPGDGYPSLSWGWGKLKFAHYDGSSWDVTTLERKGAHNDVTSLVYDSSGNPTISYRTTGRNSAALKLASWNGNSWDIEVVDAGAGARYNSLAYDSDGYPAIAYSHDVSGNNYLDTLKYAHWNGNTWDITTVETGTNGFGVFAEMAFDPVTGNPAIVHGGSGSVRFLSWDGSTWNLEVVDTAQYNSGTSIVFGDDGTAYVSYLVFGTTPQKSMFATRIGSNDWDLEEVGSGSGMSWRTSLELDSLGTPTMSYKNSDGLIFAKKL
jgi:hypothetical protein